MQCLTSGDHKQWITYTRKCFIYGYHVINYYVMKLISAAT